MFLMHRIKTHKPKNCHLSLLFCSCVIGSQWTSWRNRDGCIFFAPPTSFLSLQWFLKIYHVGVTGVCTRCFVVESCLLQYLYGTYYFQLFSSGSFSWIMHVHITLPPIIMEVENGPQKETSQSHETMIMGERVGYPP